MTEKFFDRRRNRIVAGIIAIIGILLGIGTFIGVMLLRKHNINQQRQEDQLKNTLVTKQNDTSLGTTVLSTPQPTYSKGSDVPSATPVSSLDPTSFDEKKVVESTIFYAIGDTPYTAEQAVELQVQLLNIPDDAEFLIHVGDIFFKRGNTCLEQDYIDVATMLKTSKVPVYIILGDNEYNDCPNHEEGLVWWQEQFSHFTERFWPTNKFNITYQPNRADNFAFINKGTLFIGLDIVGGKWVDNNRTDWDIRLQDEAQWTISLIRDLVSQSLPAVPRVVIFGHANPKRIHHLFFATIATFIDNSLNNGIPILYLCGDRHRWLYETNFYDQPSWTRIILTGKTDDPPLKVIVPNDGIYTPYAFQFDRMLPKGHPALDGIVVLNDDEYSGTDDLFADISQNIYRNEAAINSTQLFAEMEIRLSSSSTSSTIAGAETWPTTSYVTSTGQIISNGTTGNATILSNITTN
jgi:Calcineurin-like phosphoesterase